MTCKKDTMLWNNKKLAVHFWFTYHLAKMHCLYLRISIKKIRRQTRLDNSFKLRNKNVKRKNILYFYISRSPSKINSVSVILLPIAIYLKEKYKKMAHPDISKIPPSNHLTQQYPWYDSLFHNKLNKRITTIYIFKKFSNLSFTSMYCWQWQIKFLYCVLRHFC